MIAGYAVHGSIGGMRGEVPERGARGLALIDPQTGRREWLLPLQLDGRRSPTPYRSRQDYRARRAP